MNSVLKQRLLRLKDVQDIAKAAQESCLPETFTTIMKSRMGLVERLYWKTAEFCVVHAMQSRRRRTSRELLKLSAIEGKQPASGSHQQCQAPGIPRGRKRLVRVG
jgi:hypothetical protein